MAEDCIIPGYHTSRRTVLHRVGQVTFTYDAWDNSIYGPKVVQDETGLFRMYYTAYAADGTWSIAMATATNIEGPWTKPELGLYTYGANALNNIVLKVGGNNMQFADMFIDPISGTYVMSVRNDSSGSGLLYWSPDGVNFTYVSAPMTSAGHGGAIEIKALSWNPVDNKYRAWYVTGHVGQQRSIGYYDCATLNGTWVGQPWLADFTSAAATLQYYDFSPFYYAGTMWAVVNVYDSTTEKLGPLRLYRSEDHGNTWDRTTDLLRRVESPEWDAGLITDGCPILVDGVWYFYYGGKTGLHNNLATPISLGLAKGVQNPSIANISKINGITVIGEGTAASRWRAV